MNDRIQPAPLPVLDTALVARTGPRLRPEDLAACHRMLAAGSKSFATAARLLPARMRDPAAVFYAFCRMADDLVDDGDDPRAAVAELELRLDAIFEGQPVDDPVDRALAAVVAEHALPRAPFDGLVEGFLWDAEAKTYETLADVLDYSARVASTMGVVMTYLLGERRPEVLARACDLGAAMQLTNICRDVAEDAARGRRYLPAAWLRRGGLDPATWDDQPTDHPALRRAAKRLLDHADELYARAEAGIPELPADGRAAIYAARLIYADIGRVIRGRGYDVMAGRAVVGRGRKLWLVLRAWLTTPRRRQPDALGHAPLDETAFLCGAGPEWVTPALAGATGAPR